MKAVVITDGESPFFGLGVAWQTTLWQLEHWDYTGRVDQCFIRWSSGNNLCLDPAVGPNAWDYWFEQPFPESRGAELLPNRFGRRLVVSGHSVWPSVERNRMRYVAQRWMRVKSDVFSEVDAICRTIEPDKTVAVHLRGTDKHTEALRYGETARVSDGIVRDRVAQVQAKTGCWKIYGLTDDQRYADLLHNMGATIRSIPRGVVSDKCGDNLLAQRPGVQTGRDALVDILVAARCKAIARTPSNLGSIALSLGDPEEYIIHPHGLQ